MTDHRDPRTTARRTVVVGPFPIYFGNVNVAMGLRGHYHTGRVTLAYGYQLGDHGYPSFKDTNDALRAKLEELTHGIFRDATNEDVADRLWQGLCEWTASEWVSWGGRYWLAELHLDVDGVWDDIGHDAGTTRYSIHRDHIRDSLPRAQVLPNTIDSTTEED